MRVGTYSFFAAQAGAAKVWAVEGGPIVNVAKTLARVNGVADRVELIRGWFPGVAIPEPVDVLIFEEIAGLVRMELLKTGAAVVGARLASPTALEIGDTIPIEIVAEACGLSVDHIETRHHRPLIASCGAPFVLAELKGRTALTAARPRAEVFEQHVPMDDATGIHLYVQSGSGDVDIHARMFAPLHGVVEDPATGSANVALIGLLAHLDEGLNTPLEKRIAQGDDMGRPSLLEARAEKNHDGTITTYIGGTCVPVMRGVIEVV